MPAQDPYCSMPPGQMLSVSWDLGHPTHHWNSAESVLITSHDEEEDGSVEFYIPSCLAHWHTHRPR
eukprot:4112748-Prorocentrum_lima.AAC.1